MKDSFRTNLQARDTTEMVIAQPISFVNATTLTDGSIRYTIPYRMDLTVLPKLNAVILDPESKWNGHPKISLEFKKFNRFVTCSGILSHIPTLCGEYNFLT